MVDHISIDVTDAKQSAVPKEKFRINKYNFGTPFEDLVHGKLYATYVNRPEILLYVGCTENVYIKSCVKEVKPEEFKSIMTQAAHWFRFYGNEVTEESKIE